MYIYIFTHQVKIHTIRFQSPPFEGDFFNGSLRVSPTPMPTNPQK